MKKSNYEIDSFIFGINYERLNDKLALFILKCKGEIKLTFHHFIAADKELPIGSFGEKSTIKTINEINLRGKRKQKKDIDKAHYTPPINVYEGEEDVLGIDVKALDPGYEMIRAKFKKMFVYEVTGYLHITGKSIKALFSYINLNLFDGEDIEIYTCLDGEEEREKNDNLDTIINLKTFQLGKHIKLDKKNYLNQLGDIFFLEDRQYIIVSK